MASTNSPLEKKQYFPAYTSYQNQANTIEMYDKLIVQYFQIYGLPIDFVPAIVDVDFDRIFGEDSLKKYLQKYKLTTILGEGKIEENLIFNSFGQLNNVEFTAHLHIGTYKNIIGKDKDPKPGDQLFFSFGSNLGYEITNVNFSNLGMEGNILGQRTCYKIVVREREVSEPDEGYGENYGGTIRITITSDLVNVPLHVVNNKNFVQILTPAETDIGKTVTVISATAPKDIMTSDGRIKDKYIVKGKNLKAQKGDNQFINDFTDTKSNTLQDPRKDIRPDGNTVPFNKDLWGGW